MKELLSAGVVKAKTLRKGKGLGGIQYYLPKRSIRTRVRRTIARHLHNLSNSIDHDVPPFGATSTVIEALPGRKASSCSVRNSRPRHHAARRRDGRGASRREQFERLRKSKTMGSVSGVP